MSNAQVSRLISSYSADLVHGVTRGRVLTAKHFVLSMGIHNITGSRRAVEINNKLGHGMNYNLTCECETAIAEKSLRMAEQSNILPLEPFDCDSFVPTYFWVDNFDVTVEKVGGGGSVNTTHLVAFQEQVQGAVPKTETYSGERTRRRVFQYDERQWKGKIDIDKKKDPALIAKESEDFEFDPQFINLKYG